jgi:hypothetical protein
VERAGAERREERQPHPVIVRKTSYDRIATSLPC